MEQLLKALAVGNVIKFFSCLPLLGALWLSGNLRHLPSGGSQVRIPLYSRQVYRPWARPSLAVACISDVSPCMAALQLNSTPLIICYRSVNHTACPTV